MVCLQFNCNSLSDAVVSSVDAGNRERSFVTVVLKATIRTMMVFNNGFVQVL